MEPVAIITDEFQAIIESIRRRHIQAVWSILSLHVGHESAISRKDLVKRVRFTIGRPKYSERAVRVTCQLIRDAGIPVCSDRFGYWVGTPTETLAWASWYKAHAFSMLRTAKVLVAGARHLLTDPDDVTVAAQLHNQVQLALDLERKD